MKRRQVRRVITGDAATLEKGRVPGIECGLSRKRGPRDGPRVIQACRQGGKLFVTLQCTREDEFYLDESMVRQLLVDLKEVCEGL